MYNLKKKTFILLAYLSAPAKTFFFCWIVAFSALFDPTLGLALDTRDARHLLARTGFGLPRPDEIAVLKHLNRAEAIESLLNAINSKARTSPPDWIGYPMPAWKVRKTWTEPRKRGFNQLNRTRWRELQGWWISEMLTTSSPLTERLVLFWHNHFTSSFDEVKWVPMLYKQNVTFRQHAAGNFRELLTAMITDPAMLFYLDGRRNQASKPNENFARELLELFTMGEGQGYTEKDIREMARALSGWTVDLETLTPVFRKKHYDRKTKTLLGRSGPFNSNDIVGIILDHPRPAKYLTERFYRAFVGETLDRPTVDAVARDFRLSHYSLRVLLRSLLNSEAFWAEETRGSQIKSPVDMVVGLARLADWEGDNEVLINRMNGMGQRLFQPPNVKGWPGGVDWISSISLRRRNSFVKAMTKVLKRGGGLGMAGMQTMPKGMRSLMAGSERSPNEIQIIVLAVPPVREVSLDRLSPAAHLMALFRDPAFQMK